MPVQTIDLAARVQAEREKCTKEARSQFEDCLLWLAGPAQALALHDVERDLLQRAMALGCAFVARSCALRLPTTAAPSMTHGRASYSLEGLMYGIVRSRFGELWALRPQYRRIHGNGPVMLAPQDRANGLVAGRMSLGVHLVAGYLAAKMAFDEVVDVMSQFGGYVPSKRAIFGIVDKLGPPARMAKVFVIYTLRRAADGTLEGPLNKRVIVSFGSRKQAFEMALREATKRGCGTKRTYFLADGARAIWSMQREFFPLATACVDWYHVCEYLWKAGGTVFKEGSPTLAEWVHARKNEMLAGKVDKMLATVKGLGTSIAKSGPGTKGRRTRLGKALGYLVAQKERLRYAELSKIDMDIATGAVEGAVNHVVGAAEQPSGIRPITDQ